MRVLVLGGAGFLGSHTLVALAEAGHAPVALDNLVNASARAVERAAGLGGRAIPLVVADVRDAAALERALREHRAEAVIHFAAHKAVARSVREPLEYFDNNVGGTVAVLRAMQQAGVERLVFSSSATVYGVPARVPIAEDAPRGAVNPYGHTKHACELLIEDACAAGGRLAALLLRYFNPVGAHPSGRLGEDPRGTPDNLMPFVSQVAVGRRPWLPVFGADWPTPDGTCVRDYLHVMDLAEAHVAALGALEGGAGRAPALNLGTGRGHSVREVVAEFERAAGRPIPTRVEGRRAGDVAVLYADCGRAAQVLGWRAQRDLRAMCADAWRFQRENPSGYAAG